jgi:hypothetical protein
MFQGRGIGSALTGLTIQRAHANGLTLLTATTLWETAPPADCCEATDFAPGTAAAAKSSTSSGSQSSVTAGTSFAGTRTSLVS